MDTLAEVARSRRKGCAGKMWLKAVKEKSFSIRRKFFFGLCVHFIQRHAFLAPQPGNFNAKTDILSLKSVDLAKGFLCSILFRFTLSKSYLKSVYTHSLLFSSFFHSCWSSNQLVKEAF